CSPAPVTSDIYPVALHDALPIFEADPNPGARRPPAGGLHARDGPLGLGFHGRRALRERSLLLGPILGRGVGLRTLAQGLHRPAHGLADLPFQLVRQITVLLQVLTGVLFSLT